MDSRFLPAVPLADEETVECHKQECGVLDIFKDVQKLVEMSNVINVSINCCF